MHIICYVLYIYVYKRMHIYIYIVAIRILSNKTIDDK